MVLHSAETGKYLDWLARLMMESIESTGVMSAEIFPSVTTGTEWALLQQFYTDVQIDAWLSSEGRKKMMEELAPDLASQKVTLLESRDPTYANIGSVLAVVTHVKEGQEKAFFAFEKKYQITQAHTPGYRGAYLQPPTKETAGTWTTLIRFDSPQSMDKWFHSEERKQIVSESEKLVRFTDYQHVTTSFPGWFPTMSGGEGPPNWKTALLILLGLYPSVMLVILYFLPIVKRYPTALDNFLGNIITVAVTTWVTMPLFIKVYHSWLFPTVSTPKWVNPISLISLLLFFAAEIAFFWRFF